MLGIVTALAAGASLSQQVPVLIQLDLELDEPPSVIVAGSGFSRNRCSSATSRLM